jgi:hypothetical protein
MDAIKEKVMDILGCDFTFDAIGIMEKLKVRGFQASLSTLYVDNGDDGHYWTYSSSIQDSDGDMNVTGSDYDADPIVALCKAVVQTFEEKEETEDE